MNTKENTSLNACYVPDGMLSNASGIIITEINDKGIQARRLHESHKGEIFFLNWDSWSRSKWIPFVQSEVPKNAPTEQPEPTDLLNAMIEAPTQIKERATPSNTLPWEKQEPLTTDTMAHLLDEISSIATKALVKQIADDPCELCGSSAIVTSYDEGWDIDEEGEERQHIDTCKRCGAWRFNTDRTPLMGDVRQDTVKYFGKWHKKGE